MTDDKLKVSVISTGKRFREVVVLDTKHHTSQTSHEETFTGKSWSPRKSAKSYRQISDSFYSANKVVVSKQQKPVLRRTATGTHTRVDGIHPMFWKAHEHHVDKHHITPKHQMNELISQVSFSDKASPDMAKNILDSIGYGSTTVRAV